jgi:hypothetical protein
MSKHSNENQPSPTNEKAWCKHGWKTGGGDNPAGPLGGDFDSSEKTDRQTHKNLSTNGTERPSARFHWCFGYGTSEVLLLLLLVGGVCCGVVVRVAWCCVRCQRREKHDQTSHGGVCGRTWACGAFGVRDFSKSFFFTENVTERTRWSTGSHTYKR